MKVVSIIIFLCTSLYADTDIVRAISAHDVSEVGRCLSGDCRFLNEQLQNKKTPLILAIDQLVQDAQVFSISRAVLHIGMGATVACVCFVAGVFCFEVVPEGQERNQFRFFNIPKFVNFFPKETKQWKNPITGDVYSTYAQTPGWVNDLADSMQSISYVAAGVGGLQLLYGMARMGVWPVLAYLREKQVARTQGIIALLVGRPELDLSIADEHGLSVLPYVRSLQERQDAYTVRELKVVEAALLQCPSYVRSTQS